MLRIINGVRLTIWVDFGPLFHFRAKPRPLALCILACGLRGQFLGLGQRDFAIQMRHKLGNADGAKRRAAGIVAVLHPARFLECALFEHLVKAFLDALVQPVVHFRLDPADGAPAQGNGPNA